MTVSEERLIVPADALREFVANGFDPGVRYTKAMARELLALREAVTWRTMESAPKETRVMVAWEQSPYDDIPWAMQVARKSKFDGVWRSTIDSRDLPFQPTMWRPITAPTPKDTTDV